MINLFPAFIFHDKTIFVSIAIIVCCVFVFLAAINFGHVRRTQRYNKKKREETAKNSICLFVPFFRQSIALREPKVSVISLIHLVMRPNHIYYYCYNINDSNQHSSSSTRFCVCVSACFSFRFEMRKKTLKSSDLTWYHAFAVMSLHDINTTLNRNKTQTVWFIEWKENWSTFILPANCLVVFFPFLPYQVSLRPGICSDRSINFSNCWNIFVGI